MKPKTVAPDQERAAVAPIQQSNFTVRTLARAESVSVPTIWREIAAGRLTAIKIGRLTRITPEDHAKWKAGLTRVGRAA